MKRANEAYIRILTLRISSATDLVHDTDLKVFVFSRSYTNIFRVCIYKYRG